MARPVSTDIANKLIFPREWDLSEAENLSGLKHCGRMACEADDVHTVLLNLSTLMPDARTSLAADEYVKFFISRP